MPLAAQLAHAIVGRQRRAEVADIVAEGGEDQFLVSPLVPRQLGSLHHVFQLADGFADVVGLRLRAAQGQ
ncbi:hypothetical protein D9M69_626700 [compost metagenome]